MTDPPLAEIEVQRGGGITRLRQELLADWPNLKITLQVVDSGFRPVRLDESTTVRPGWTIMWYLRPGQPFEIGAFHDRRGALQGYYVNVTRPLRMEEPPWVIEDLYLDVWAPRRGSPLLLDEDELAAAVASGALAEAEADSARALARSTLRRVGRRSWPPAIVRHWPLELAPALRLRRDQPGTFHAARVSGRIIAFGLYVMGAASATSVAFAALTDAFLVPGAAQRAWAAALVVEAALLAPLALGGWLPATRWPRPPLTDERSLFIATVAGGVAVVAINDRAAWSDALLPVYAALGLFAAVFAVCRWRYDRIVPVMALAGVAMTALALVLLL